MTKSRKVPVTFLVVAMTIAPLATAFAGITPEQKCASAKMKAVGKKYAAKAKCYAKALSQSAAVDAACLQLAESKFQTAFDKAEAKGGCLNENNAAAIEAKIDTCLADVVGDLGCGNGVQEGDEQCDDGNVISGDGCSSTCLDEGCVSDANCPSGQLCVGGVCVAPACGDGLVQGGEQCDDGNVISGDGCDSNCTTEGGYDCSGTPSVCQTVCGDGIVAGSEQCDDFNTFSGDGCDSNCLLECQPLGAACSVAVDCCSNVCSGGVCVP